MTSGEMFLGAVLIIAGSAFAIVWLIFSICDKVQEIKSQGRDIKEIQLEVKRITRHLSTRF